MTRRAELGKSPTAHAAVPGQQAERSAHASGARENSTIAHSVTAVAGSSVPVRVAAPAEVLRRIAEREGAADEPVFVYRLPPRPAGPGAIARRRARRVPGGAPAQLETYRTSFLEKEQSGTYFTISGEPVQRLLEQLADDPRAHYFRREVAKHLEPKWPNRARALLSCGEAGARCDCVDCGARHVFPYRCGARSCPNCAGTASAIKCEKVARQAESAQELNLLGPWDGVGPARKKGWRMLHLTTAAKKTEDERYDPETLRAYVLAVRQAWGPFWRSTSWGDRINDMTERGTPTKRVRRDTLAAMGIEVGDGGMVHIHAAVYGEYIPDTEIRDLWKEACPFGGFVKIRMMRDEHGELLTRCDAQGIRDALREVLKYCTKGHKAKNLPERAERAAAAEYALRNQRRVETCGALRLVPTIDEKELATDAQQCTACGSSGNWLWRGVRAPHYVQRNNGFGLAVILDTIDADQLDENARDARSHFRVEREIGGKYYGGAPPPWMDDPEEWQTIDEGRAWDHPELSQLKEPHDQVVHQLRGGVLREVEE